MLSPQIIADIDRRACEWRQGDFVLTSDLPFIYLADLKAPLTEAAQQLASENAEGLQVVDVEIPGFVVVTQTCDIVRSCIDRKYVEVCPLLKLPAGEMSLVRSGRRGQLLAVPALDSMMLAADLDRVMTIEKAVLISFDEHRRSGVTSEAHAREFSNALGKKRSRAAFPNEFVTAIKPLRKRIIDKHDRDTAEGRFLRSVREIRISPKPNWIDAEIEVEFLFIFDFATQICDSYEAIVEDLMKYFPVGGRFVEVHGRNVGLDELSAAAYFQSDLLELDHLSQASED